jgi:hypothetical protein
LPGTDGPGRVFICLSVREHWSSHRAGAVEHSTLLYCIARVSCTLDHVRTMPVGSYSLDLPQGTYVRMFALSWPHEGVWAETLPKPAYVLPRPCCLASGTADLVAHGGVH